MKKAFTLIELLVVVAIIGILIALLVPIFFQARKANMNASRDPFIGCRNPKVTSITSIGTGTLEKPSFVYTCEDGRQISSTIPPQDLRR